FLAVLEQSGFEVGSQIRYLAHLVPQPGNLGGRAPSAAEVKDIRVGLAIAARIAALDIGQAVAVRNGAVVAVEAAEGTDAMIRRAGALAAGVVVVKVSRPQQDPRYDLPVVGPETVRALVEARGTALAVEAGRTILLDREQTAAAAAEAGIAGVDVRIESLRWGVIGYLEAYVRLPVFAVRFWRLVRLIERMGPDLLVLVDFPGVNRELVRHFSGRVPMVYFFPPQTHARRGRSAARMRSEEHTSELQSRGHLVCRLLLEKKKENR